MIKICRIIENAEFRTVDLHLATRSYSIKILESEIDEELKKHDIDPARQRLYATPVNLSRNMLAANIAEQKLLDILSDELLGINSEHEYLIKKANDWDSIQSHNKVLSRDLDNNDKYWGDAKRKYTMINGKHLYQGE